MIAATYVRRSVCDCGSAVLRDSVPLGTTYQVEPESIMLGGLLCSCGRKTYCDLIQTDDGGWLPMDILDLEGAAA
jgi:hypothetical protein